MKEHNKITFAKEYCLCRRIPYKFKGEQLTIGEGGNSISFFSVYNFTYADLIKTIDQYVIYDNENCFYKEMNNNKIYA